MRTEEGKRAAALAHDRYDKANTTPIKFKFNNKTDADIAFAIDNGVGYFVVDPDTTPDHLVFNRVVGLRDSWAKASQKG